MITISDVEHVALLGRLDLSEEEKKMYAGQLSAILEYAGMLDDLDTENVQPTAHVLPLRNVFREDRLGDHMDLDKTLQNAPDKDGKYFKVPRIV